MSPKMIVIKNLNYKIHKLLPIPSATNCTDVLLFKGMCQGMF